MKKKKEDKLGHLIEIHKEIYKMHLKKGASVQIGKNRKIVRM